MINSINKSSDISAEMINKYFKSLVNSFFKILPLKENNEPTLTTYIESLQIELLGCKGVIAALNNDPLFLSLISILQYLMDFPECSVHEVKREVFKAISICNKLKATYSTELKQREGSV